MSTEFSSGGKLRKQGIIYVDSQLEFLGYVERRLNERRRTEYRLTPKGTELAEAVKNLLKVINETLPKGGSEDVKNIFKNL